MYAFACQNRASPDVAVDFFRTMTDRFSRSKLSKGGIRATSRGLRGHKPRQRGPEAAITPHLSGSG